MRKDEWGFDWLDPLMEDALYRAVEDGCDLGIKGESDMAEGKTRWFAKTEGSFFMHIAGIAELIKAVAIKQAKSFEDRDRKHKDGTPITWEDVAEVLLVSSAAFLGFDIRVVGRCNLEEDAMAEAEEMSKYKEI